MGQPKGCIAWNKGKKGVQVSPMKGRNHTQEANEKNRLAHLGKPSGKKGWKASLETIEKMREASKRQVNRRGPEGKPWSIERRQAQEARTGKPYVKGKRNTYTIKGERKPVIKNGKEYHPLWHDIRKLVYKRDGWVCQECGVHCGTSDKTKIQCHHIDYDIPNNDLSNLITLCAGCHAKTNFRRENWIIHYRKKLNERMSIIYS